MSNPGHFSIALKRPIAPAVAGDVYALIRGIKRKAGFAEMHMAFLAGIRWEEIDQVGRRPPGGNDRACLRIPLSEATIVIEHPTAVIDHIYMAFDGLLEEAHIKVSSVVSDLLGTSARRMLQGLADGETDSSALAALADSRLRATPDQLRNAFGACADLHPVYRRLVKLTLEELRVIEDHLAQLDQQMAELLGHHHDAVHRLAEVPGLGVDSAQQIIAEVGATAATFPSPKHLASWMGACPGTEESAGKNYSHRCPKGNRQMRRVLNQAANAAVKAKGTIFAIVYRRLVPRLGHAQAIGAITHRLCRLIWKILHQSVRYEERGPAVSVEAKKVRTRKMIRELRTLGYRIELISPTPVA